MTPAESPPRNGAGSPFEVLRVFLKLGLTSFGGPVAHLGYFRDEFVVKRGWLDERAFADTLGLCQFLPGPASSQTGFAIGLLRAGYVGGFAAWAGFTLPSAIALTIFAYCAGALTGPAGEGLLHGLKLVAVAIVAQAVLGMARNLAPDRPRAAIAILALIVTAFAPGSANQLLGDRGRGRSRTRLLPAGRHGGSRWRRGGAGIALLGPRLPLGIFRPARVVLYGRPDGRAAFLAAICRSGALVFGGGHVVLPLLQGAVVAPGFVTENAFLAGYGAAQAVPGPLFTFAAFLGASRTPGRAVLLGRLWR